MNSSSSLAAELMAQLQGAPMQQMADQIGASPAQTESAVGAALPVLLASLGRNAADPQGAANLFGALQRDHGAHARAHRHLAVAQNGPQTCLAKPALHTLVQVKLWQMDGFKILLRAGGPVKPQDQRANQNTHKARNGYGVAAHGHQRQHGQWPQVQATV